MEPITVLIADDHSVAREGLRAMLGSDESFQMVGEAADGAEALELALALRPMVTLVDVRMPVLDGLEVTRRLRAECPTIAVIMISSYDDNALVIGAVRAGAAGYLLKDVSRDLLCHAIRAVVGGGMLFKASLLRHALIGSETEDEREPSGNTLGLVEMLSPREQEVLGRLVEGATNRQIASALGLAEVTVKKHMQIIIAKLGASDRTGAAIAAMRRGLVE